MAFNLLGGEGFKSIFQWAVLLFLFMFVIPKLYFYQIFAKIESSAIKLEELSTRGQRIVIKTTSKFGRQKKELREMVSRFIDFFMIPPVNLDPFGIMKKLEHLINNTEDRFKDTAKKMVPKADSEKTMDVYMGLQAAVSINMIAKIVRHYVELVKKFKNLQFAMILQMQLPLIEKLAESEFKGLNAFLEGQAIGDGAGPLVVASLLGKEGEEKYEDALVRAESIWGKKITFIKAKGPGGRLGKIGDAVEDICKKKNISKIITIDAAQKLEGEKTGSVAEGIGVAIGGAGVERAKIEEIATRHKIPLEAIAIKMSPFEAISPMPLEVADAVSKAGKFLEERVKETKGKNIVVVGVGNTCGIPNSKKGLVKVLNKIKRRAKKIKAEEEAKEKRWFSWKKEESPSDSPIPTGGMGMFLNSFYNLFGFLER